jgi:hypothetical protein
MASGDVRNIEIAWRTIVLKAEPEFHANRKKELLYEFSNGKQFRGDPTKVATAYPDE